MYVVSIEAVVAVVPVLSVLSEVFEVSAGKGFLADHFKICETYRHFFEGGTGEGGELGNFLGHVFFWSQ